MLKLDWGDSQVWMTAAVELHNNATGAPDSRNRLEVSRYPKENELNVACVCAGYAFELIFKVLVKLNKKQPKPVHKPSVAYRDILPIYRTEVERIAKLHGWIDITNFLQFLDESLCQTDRKYWGQPPGGGQARATFHLAGIKSINALYKLHVEFSNFVLDAINRDLDVHESHNVNSGERRWLSNR